MVIWFRVVPNRTVVAVTDPHLQISGGGGGRSTIPTAKGEGRPPGSLP